MRRHRRRIHYFGAKPRACLPEADRFEAQGEINALIAELASAKGAKKQELIRNIEASEAQILSLRAQLGRAKAELDKAKTKALKACVTALEAPPRKPSLAERCGAARAPAAGGQQSRAREADRRQRRATSRKPRSRSPSCWAPNS